jgi:4-hydroxy 2-oxovalerate aldolase
VAKINLLDCTLRDGAYITEGQFGQKNIKGILGNLQESGIDIIEVGWLKNNPHELNTTYFEKVEEVNQYLCKKHENTQYILMLDFGKYDINKLSDKSQTMIDAIRIVFPKEKYNDVEEFSLVVKKKGYGIFYQAASTQCYSDDELKELAKVTNKIKPIALSIVDTLGTMYPEDLERIFKTLDKHLDRDIKIAFHSHNNLQLSFALSMVFIKLGMNADREIVIDSSLCGMGRGAGNTCTELITNFVNCKYNGHYDINIIMDTIDRYIKPYMNKYQWGYSIPYCIAGQLGSHVNNIKYLQDIHKTNFVDMKLILEAMPKDERRFYDYDKLEKVYSNYQNQKNS